MAIDVLAAPRIECENPKFDFGTLIGQEKITHDFVVWNRGDEPLEISKIKNCCGVETKVIPMTIPPGSNAVCSSVFTTKNRYGVQNKQILLVTNDKKNLYYDLRMTGTLLKPVEFSPRYIRLKDVLPDTVVSETISVTNLLEEAITLESVSTTVDGLAAEVVRDDALGPDSADERNADRTSAPRRSWTVQLKSNEPLAIGSINGRVQLHFSTGTVNVPVIGAVAPIIQATPDKIQLSEGTSIGIERLVMLRSGDDRDFEVLSARLDNAEGEVAAKKLAAGKWQVKLTIQADSIKTDASVIIKTSIESQEIITIPLSKK